MSDIYNDEFKSWSDVAEQFSPEMWSMKPEERDIARAALIPEPEEVIFAGYNTPSYEGYALVIYRNGEDYFSVEGSHCSCYGLEGQWKPEQYTKEVLRQVWERKLENLEKRDYNSDYDYERKDVAKSILEKLA